MDVASRQQPSDIYDTGTAVGRLARRQPIRLRWKGCLPVVPELFISSRSACRAKPGAEDDGTGLDMPHRPLGVQHLVASCLDEFLCGQFGIR